MMILTLKELESRGVSRQESKDSSTLQFSNKIFTRGADFSQRVRQAAINFAQEYLKSKIFSLIVDHPMYLTVWVEREDTNLPGETASFTKASVTPNDTDILWQSSFQSEQPVQTARQSTLSTSALPEDTDIPSRSQFQSEQPVQTPQPSARSTDNPPSIDSPSTSVGSTPTSSDTSIPPKDMSKLEAQSDTESSPDRQASAKKRPRRRYRGISY